MKAMVKGIALGIAFLAQFCHGTDALDTWIRRNSGMNQSFYGITYGNGTFVAVGPSGTNLISADGVTWTGGSSSPFVYLNSITYGKGLFVAVGSHGQTLASADGATWSIGFAQTFGDLSSIAYGNGNFVVAGYDILASSVDGFTWIRRNPGIGEFFSGIAYGNDRFVAVGSEGVGISTDGILWQQQQSTGGHPICYGSGLFVAFGVGGLIRTSPDGITWTERNSGTDQWISSVTYGNGTFVAVGDYVILTSTDGMIWTQRNSVTNAQLRSVAYGGGHFVAVGAQGIILQSGDAAPEREYQVIDLGTLGGSYSGASGINARGEVVGSSDNGYVRAAFLYSNGSMRNLGYLGSGGPDNRALAINNAGNVVGSVGISHITIRAFFYAGGSMIELGTLGGQNSSASAINSTGQIVGDSQIVPRDS